MTGRKAAGVSHLTARPPRTLAPAANDAPVRKSRRLRVMCIGSLPYSILRASGWTYAFSSRLRSFRKRQSVPSAIITVGARLDHVDLVQPECVDTQRALRVKFAPEL